MMQNTLRFASRLCGVLAFLALASALAAQPPKDPPKEKDKEPSPDEQKAKEAFLAGKLDDALKLLQTAAKTNPALDPPKAIVAQWCVETQQGPQARVLIEQAAAEDPAHPQVLLVNASFALAEGRITDTVLSCREALAAAESPRWDAETKKRYRREARLGLVAAYDVRGDFTSAKTHLAALLADDPKNAQLRQRLARASFLVGSPDDAFSHLQTAFKDDPTLDPAELGMAQLWTGKYDFPKADEWYTKAVAAHPNSAKVHRGFAGYLLDRGRTDAAKAHLAAAQKIEPGAKETKALAGLFARYTKDYAAATQIFEELAREHPSYAFASANLAIVLAEAGDANAKRRAVELAEAYVRQNQRSAEARALYGFCLLKAGRTADAEQAAKSAFGLGQLGPDGAYFLAKVLADRGAVENAHKIIKAACESKDGFVYRKDGEALLAELEKKLPPPKK
jgi:Tfp pilus assembly protein PilF